MIFGTLIYGVSVYGVPVDDSIYKTFIYDVCPNQNAWVALETAADGFAEVAQSDSNWTNVYKPVAIHDRCKDAT